MVRALAARNDFRDIILAGDPDELAEWVEYSKGHTPLHVLRFVHRRHSPLVPLQWYRVARQVSGPCVTWFPHWDGAWNVPHAVTTLHDVIHLNGTGLIGAARARVTREWMGRMIKGSAQLLTPSTGAESAIVAAFPEAEPKITVVRHGVASVFHAAAVGKLPPAARDEPGVPPKGTRYLLTVASKRPHKRLETALRAFARLAVNDTTLRLVMVGAQDSHTQALRSLARSLGVAARVDDVAHLNDAALAWTYAGAEALLVPSREEGFGLIVLEAMACGTPVIIVDAAPLPEVAGHAALIVPVDDDAKMASAVRTLDRAYWRAKGLARAASFTWEHAAARTSEVLLAAL